MVKLPHLWSLADMIEHFALRFCKGYHQYLGNLEALIQLEKEHKTKPLNERVLSPQRKECIAESALRPMIVELDHLHFDMAVCTKAKRLYARLVDRDSRNWTAESLLDSLTELNGDITRELDKHKFVQLRLGGEQYLENEYLFGSDVFTNFKQARQEIRDAGNTFASEMYTASVFHLTRVAEHGLRVIARRLKVTIKDNGKNVPLEYGDWNKVITAIENKIRDARKNLAGTKKEARLNYYSDALERCSAMKDHFRNPVSHTRTRYTEGKALDAMERVRNFMQFLARSVPK